MPGWYSARYAMQDAGEVARAVVPSRAAWESPRAAGYVARAAGCVARAAGCVLRAAGLFREAHAPGGAQRAVVDG